MHLFDTIGVFGLDVFRYKIVRLEELVAVVMSDQLHPAGIKPQSALDDAFLDTLRVVLDELLNCTISILHTLRSGFLGGDSSDSSSLADPVPPWIGNEASARGWNSREDGTASGNVSA